MIDAYSSFESNQTPLVTGNKKMSIGSNLFCYLKDCGIDLKIERCLCSVNNNGMVYYNITISEEDIKRAFSCIENFKLCFKGKLTECFYIKE